MALPRPDYNQMEVYWIPIMDPRKTCVSVIIDGKRLLTDSDYPSGIREKRRLVRFPRLLPVGTHCSLVPPSSKTLRLNVKPDQRSWPIFTSISRTSESKHVTTYCFRSYPSFPLVLVFAVVFSTAFTRHTTMAHDSRVTRL